MKDLIERLEKATGPDRELEYAIHIAMEGNQVVPYYTASIDDALTLVPEGWCSLMAWNPTDAICSISMKPLGNFDNLWPGDGKAPTPALALCIAALKARDFAERDLTKEAGK